MGTSFFFTLSILPKLRWFSTANRQVRIFLFCFICAVVFNRDHCGESCAPSRNSSPSQKNGQELLPYIQKSRRGYCSCCSWFIAVSAYKEIDWSDTYHNQVNRKGGFDGKNSFYSARKILFGQQRTAQRTFSKGIWTIYRRWTVQYRSFKILRLIWHPWIWGENAVCFAWTIVHKKKGANHESGNLLPPEQRRWI